MEIDRTVGLYADFARFLSTCPEEEHRDGMYALKIMKLNEGVHDDKHKFPTEYIEVFAAVYAEGGEFDEAVEKQTEAVKQLMADKKTPAAELKRAEKVLELYENKKPLRDE